MEVKEGLAVISGENGQVSMDAIVNAIVFFLGLAIFVILFNPLVRVLIFPYLENEEIFGLYGAPAQLVILLIPLVMVVMGMVGIINSFRRPPPPQVYYG